MCQKVAFPLPGGRIAPVSSTAVHSGMNLIIPQGRPAVVMLALCFDFALRVVQRQEPMQAQEFLPQAAMELSAWVLSVGLLPG